MFFAATDSTSAQKDSHPRAAWAISIGIAILTLTAFFNVHTLGFVDYDDGDYVFENDAVRNGISWSGVIWAFTTSHASNWHPITWFSHMLDVQVYGMHPAGHHITSLALHVINSILVFFVVRSFTGAFWRSAIVAAFFAVHPLHVESVAWISERKDVLSTFFGLFSLLAYHRYRVACETGHTGRTGFYFLSITSFALSLLSKPMLVTLPCLLLLLDYWPGRRFEGLSPKQTVTTSIREKLPFFGLAVIFCAITFLVQKSTTVMSMESFGLLERIENALVAYSVYLRRVFWPSDLAFFYPLSNRPIEQVISSAILIITITAGLTALRRRYPYGLVGWLWFLGLLIPVIGLVQVGEQSMADRYTYLPIVGIFLSLTWGAAELLKNKPGLLAYAVGVTAILVAGCGWITWLQVGYWRDSRTLLTRALSVTHNNFLANNNLGFLLAREGQINEAIPHFEAAIRAKPNYSRAYRNLGAAFVRKGEFGKAVRSYETAIALNPQDVEALRNAGTLAARGGNLDSAADFCLRAVQIAPLDPLALYDYGLVLNLRKEHREAVSVLGQSAQLRPDDPLTHFQLALTFAKIQDFSSARASLEKALMIRPDWPEALSELAWICATAQDPKIRSPDISVKLAGKANELTGGTNPQALTSLAAAYASDGNFQDAVSTAKLAIDAAEKAGQHPLADQNRAFLRVYIQEKPLSSQDSPRGEQNSAE